MTVTLQYPYNPTGTDAACVMRERYALSSTNNTYRCIVPELAPFFQLGLKVIKHPGATLLREGIDYKLGGRYHEVEAIASSDLYGIIEFINPNIIGEIEIEYATIGGNFMQSNNRILTYLANYIIDPATTHWAAILDKLTDYAMVDHEQHWADFVNKEYIANSIDSIEDAITAKSVQNDQLSVTYLNNRITQLENIVNGSRFNEHIVNLANPHGTTAAKAHALSKTAAATDAFKAYASTLTELAAYINAAGLTQAELDAFMTKEGDILLGNKLVLKDGTAKIRSDGLTSEISLSDLGITMTCKGAAKLGSDRLRNKSGKTSKFQAGKNVLQVRSKGAAFTKDDLLINDVVIIHVGNIRTYLGGIDFGSVFVTTGSTTSATMSGDGTTGSRVKVDVVYPVASNTIKGIGMLVQGYGSLTTAWGTAKALSDLVSDLSGYVPITREINGHPLSADVVLTAADFGLELTNNTADLSKPISLQQQILLDQYSATIHTHTIDEVAVNNASTTVVGVTLFYPTVPGTDAGAVPPAVFKATLDSIAEQQRLLGNMIDRDSLPVNSLVGPMSAVRGGAAWTLTFDSTQTLYYDRALYDITIPTLNLSTLFGAGNVANRQFYVYAKVTGAATATYEVKNAARDNTDGYLLAGVIHTDSTGVIPTKQDPTQSFGPFIELIDHINDPDAHMVGGPVKGTFGMGLVENYPAVNTINPYSPYAMINEWEVPSGQTEGMNESWKLSADGDTAVIETAGPVVNAIVASKICRVNMWDHQRTEPDGTKVARLVVRTVSSKLPTNTADAAIQYGMNFIVGVTKVGGTDYRLNLEHILEGGVLVDQWMLSTGTDKTSLAKNTVNDRYQVIEIPAQIPFSKEVEVRWVTPVAGSRYIQVTANFGDAKTRGDLLIGKLLESAVTGNALAAFKSGRFGLDPYLYHKALVSIDEVTLNISKKQFITANVLTEAVRKGSGVRALSGVATAAMKTIPLPLGCATGLALQSINSWQDDTGGTLSNFSIENFTLLGNEGPGGVLGPVDSPSRSMFYQQRTCTASVLKAGALTNVPVSTNYLSIGFINHINFNIIE